MGGALVVVWAGVVVGVPPHPHAASREVFARGALKAAKFMATVSQPRLYTMTDVLAAL